MGIFHDTTRIAIREMIEEFGEASRFGRVLGEDDLEAAAERIAKFLEMTLELRSSVSGRAAGALQGQTSPSPVSSGFSGAPTTRTSTLPTRRSPVGLSAGYTEEDTGRMQGSGALAGFPRTRAAAEIVAEHTYAQGAGGVGAGANSVSNANADVRLAVQHDLRLPRKRVSASDEERDVFARIRGDKR